MANLKLIYFDFSGSRGEECRLALHLAGLEFDDVRVKTDDRAARMSATPFQAFPVLMIEGKGALAQSNAILGFVARNHGLHPSDPFEAARHDALMGAVEDLRALVTPLARIKDPEEKKRLREEFASGYLQRWAGWIESQIGAGPFFAGASIGVADIKVYVVTDPFMKGMMDFIPPDVFARFPKLTALHAAVKSHPRIADWQSRKH